MNKHILRSAGCLLMLFILSAGLSGCSNAPQGGEAARTAAPVSPAASSPPARPGGGYSAMKNAWLLDSGIYDVLDDKCTSSYLWTVPRDVLSRAALDLAGAAGVRDGEYTVYRTEVSSTSTYTATGMDEEVLGISEAAEKSRQDEDGSGDGEIVTDLMGDFSVSGGGEYVRTALWRITDDLLRGTGEISMSLNGESSGKERFAFCLSDGLLYFYDVSENAVLFNEEGKPAGEMLYLITTGFIGGSSARMAEYTAASDILPSPESLPSLSVGAAGERAVLLSIEKGRGTVTIDGVTVQEFTVP